VGDTKVWLWYVTVYGPSISSVTPPVAEGIEAWLRLEGRLDGDDDDEPDWEFPAVEPEGERVAARNRSNRAYLFHTRQGVDHCYSSSQWCSKVKQAFKDFSPTGVEPSPKSLRQSFICALRDENFGDSEVLKSAARAMRHAETTQGSDTYDKRTHDRLLKASFDWCASFATRMEGEEVPVPKSEQRESREEEEDEEEDEDEEEENAEGGGEAFFEADQGAEGADEPILSTLVPIERAVAPMAALPSLRLQNQQYQQARVDPATVEEVKDVEEEASGGDNDEETYTIEAVTGGSHCEDGSVQHRVLWQGFPLETNSWNDIPLGYAWQEGACVLGQHRLVTLMPPGLATTATMNKKSFKDPLFDVCTIAADVTGPLLRLYHRNGTEVVLAIDTGRVGDREVDWLAHFEDETRLWTDAILDWSSTQQLIEIRDANLSCEAFPTLLEARALAKALPSAVPDAAPALQQAAAELDVWLRTPTLDPAMMTLAKVHAETLRKAWLPLGIIHNALSLVVGIDPGQVAELQQEIAKAETDDPAAALWDHAGL